MVKKTNEAWRKVSRKDCLISIEVQYKITYERIDSNELQSHYEERGHSV